jgi:hypothetical protein
MKLKYVLIGLIYALGLVYLFPAAPATPDLIPSTRSTEEGDTIQNPDQKGFYTYLARKDAIAQMQSKYSLIIFGQKIPSMRLNYRPEEAFGMVRDQLKSSYLEEIVYPLRDSLFVNGWEPENAPMYANTPKDKIPGLFFEDVAYFSKVTIKPNHSSRSARLIIWTLIFPASYLAFYSLKKSIQDA